MHTGTSSCYNSSFFFLKLRLRFSSRISLVWRRYLCIYTYYILYLEITICIYVFQIIYLFNYILTQLSFSRSTSSTPMSFIKSLIIFSRSSIFLPKYLFIIYLFICLINEIMFFRLSCIYLCLCVPISSILPTILPDMSSNLSYICLSKFYTNSFNSLVD